MAADLRGTVPSDGIVLLHATFSASKYASGDNSLWLARKAWTGYEACPLGTIFLHILCRHRPGIKSPASESCTMDTSLDGALLVGSRGARATLQILCLNRENRTSAAEAVRLLLG